MVIRYKHIIGFLLKLLVLVSLILGFSDRFFLTNLAPFKHFFTILLFGLLFLKYFRPRISKVIFAYSIFYFLLILYCFCLLAFFNFGLRRLIPFMLYPPLFYAGFYIASFNDVSLKTFKFLYALFFLSIIVGLTGKVLGPAYLQQLGLHLIRKDWGQSVSLLLKGNMQEIKYFRFFCFFVDHQSFSAFLVIMAFLSWLIYKYTYLKKYLFYIIFTFFSYFLTYSATAVALMVILILLFSKAKYRYLACFLIPVVFTFLKEVMPTETFSNLFHLGSLQYRRLYMAEAIKHLSFFPSNIPDAEVNFSSDCLWLWLAFRYGIFFPLILLFMFITPYFFLKYRDNREIYLIFTTVTVISMISNGFFFTSTVNIIFWFLLGFLAKDKDYSLLFSTYTGYRSYKERIT